MVASSCFDADMRPLLELSPAERERRGRDIWNDALELVRDLAWRAALIHSAATCPTWRKYLSDVFMDF